MNKAKVFKLAKGFRGRAKNCIRIVRERVEKALQYSYRDRRNKKRDMRGLWIQRINAGTRVHSVNYGNFMHGLMKENIQLNRKVLSELSMHKPLKLLCWYFDSKCWFGPPNCCFGSLDCLFICIWILNAGLSRLDYCFDSFDCVFAGI